MTTSPSMALAAPRRTREGEAPAVLGFFPVAAIFARVAAAVISLEPLAAPSTMLQSSKKLMTSVGKSWSKNCRLTAWIAASSRIATLISAAAICSCCSTSRARRINRRRSIRILRCLLVRVMENLGIRQLRQAVGEETDEYCHAIRGLNLFSRVDDRKAKKSGPEK